MVCTVGPNIFPIQSVRYAHTQFSYSYFINTRFQYDVINNYEVVAEVKINKIEAPHSDDGDGFNLNKCAAYESVSTPHARN